MISKADLGRIMEVLNSVYVWSGVSDETPSDTYILDPESGYHDGVTLEQLAQAMKTVEDLQVSASIGSGIVKIT